jgi:hypothetical protein
MNEAIISTINNLLNKTVANGCSEAEAESASRIAQSLLTKHRLTIADLEQNVEENIIYDKQSPLEKFKRVSQWKLNLATACASNNGCRIIINNNAGNKSFNLIGRESDCDIVRKLYAGLLALVDSLTADALASYRIAGKRQGVSYRLGVVASLSKRMSEGRREARKEAASTALVKLDNSDEEVKLWIDKNLRGLGTRKSSTKKIDRDAYYTGVSDGRSAPMGSVLK